jgi:hypothetical protein
MYVRGDQWPLFLYADEKFDPKRPWDGLLQNQILVLVRPCLNSGMELTPSTIIGIQAYLHIPEFS